MLEDAHGREDARVADAVASLGSLLHRLGEDEEALPLLERALELTEYNVGLDHPKTAAVLEGLGEVLLGQQRPGDALPRFIRALAVREAAPSSSTALARVLALTADTHLALGRLEDAEVHYGRALELMAGNLEPAAAARLHADLAAVALRREQSDVAFERVEDARRWARLVPERVALSIRIDALLVDVLRTQGVVKPARQHLATALTTAEPRVDGEPEALLPLLTAGGEAALADSDPAEAAALLERALPFAGTPSAVMSPSSVQRWSARTRFALAQALGQRPATEARALDLARTAAAALAGVPTDDPMRQSIERFLAR
jgi:tetratricopeptide (TPR) repeat protein